MKQLNLFRLFSACLSVCVLGALLILTSCGDDETTPPAPVSIEFATTAQTSSESGGAVTVTVQFSAAANQDGTFMVDITTDADYNTGYTTSPSGSTGTIEIEVAAGQTSAQFTVTPINNTLLDGDKVITFTLSEPSAAFTLGTDTEYELTITDDEGPSQVNFEVAEASVPENEATGIVVTLPLSSPALDAGSVEVTITSANATYSTNYTTNPAATNNVITLPVATNDESLSFTVLPVDDVVDNDNYVITFTISNATGAVIIGTNTTYELTIIDNDDEVLKTIAEIRALYVASQNITENFVIQGIVTSSNPQVNANNIWVQDNTGGIVVRFSSANNNAIARGDEVKVKLKNGQFTSFNGVMQVQNVANASATVIDQNNTLPTPQVVTLTEAATGDYEGRIIRVQNVAFVDADGVATMNGTRTISNGTNTLAVRTEATTGHPFKDSPMPLGFGTITGLAGEFNGAVQIIPQIFADDVFASNAVGTIGITQSLNDFGSVNNGAESASQSYTIQGTTLNSDVTITASAGYKVSLDNSSFTTSVTILAASANTATTVYVKFTPSTGVNQAINGTITHKSLGAAPVSFTVSGTEAGNSTGTGSLIIYEIYGGGGNSGATYTHDYVVLYNGTSNSIDLTGYSLHYGSSTGVFGTTNNANLSGVVQPGDYFLVQLAGGTNGSALPTPDLVAVLHNNASASINMSASNGKIALVNGLGATAITGPTDTNVVDFVGYGTANQFEGSAPAPALTNSTSNKRTSINDTNNNSADFAAGTPDLSYLN
jgi:hypothetical protein